MMEHVSHTTDTIGTVRETKALFNGQEQTREYTPEEKSALTGVNRPKTTGMDWMDLPNTKVDSFVSTAPREAEVKNENGGEA